LHDVLAPLDQEQRGAPRRARPEPRQSRQKLDQRVEFGHSRPEGPHPNPPRLAGEEVLKRAVQKTLPCLRGREARRSSRGRGGAAGFFKRQNGSFMPPGSASPPVSFCISASA